MGDRRQQVEAANEVLRRALVWADKMAASPPEDYESKSLLLAIELMKKASQ